MFVIKRNHEQVPYDQGKIAIAIKKALLSADKLGDFTEVSCGLADQVRHRIGNQTHVDIETIQNLVEDVLMSSEHHQAAKNYILYREKHKEIREKNQVSSTKALPTENLITSELQALADSSSRCFDHDPLREFVYIRTYSRWIPELGRREMWPETVQRYMDFIKGKCGDKLPEQTYKNIQDAVLNMEVCPSMRLAQFAGPAAERCNVCVYNCAYSAPETFKDLADILYLSCSGCGVGFSVEKHNVDKFPSFVAEEKPNTVFEYLVEDSKEGWCDSVIFALEKYFEGAQVDFDYSQIRPNGARLVTSGGRASGPEPLKELHRFIYDRIKSRRSEGKTRLSTLDVHDIICKIGSCAIAGGQRRAALISISDLGDQEIRDCKNGNIWVNNSQRYLANNSAAYNVKPTQVQFMKEWLALAESGTGERGIMNRSGLSKVLPERRVKFLGEDKIKHLGMNPCVTIDTEILTTDGWKPVYELIGKVTELLVNGSKVYTTTKGFWKSAENREVFQLELENGSILDCADDHRLRVLFDDNDEDDQGCGWIELKNINKGDLVQICDKSIYQSFCRVKSITKLEGLHDVYDCTINHAKIHWYNSNGILSHNCGEIQIQPFQFCNLTEVVCRPDDTEDSLMRKVSIATVMGTVQSSFSDFKYIDSKWKKNQDDERLLGVSLTGIMDCPALNQPGILEKLKKQAISVNREHAEFLGINPSHAITTVKPSGSVSQLVNSASGIHPRFAPYYIRRIRISDNDPLLKFMKAQGFEIHNAPEAANTSVLEFPVKAPEGAVTVDQVSALEQLEHWKRYKREWTEHNPSISVYVKPDEWLPVSKWVWDNWDDVLGISFFPYCNHVYDLAPYEEITQKEYELRLSKLKHPNFAELINYEREDHTEIEKTVACAGNSCEL